jgi:hypothetical protein
MEKNRVQVKIAGNTVTLVNTRPVEFMQAIAALVDKEIERKRQAGAPTMMGALLTACDLAERYVDQLHQTEQLQQQLARYQAAYGELEGQGSEGEEA